MREFICEKLFSRDCMICEKKTRGLVGFLLAVRKGMQFNSLVHSRHFIAYCVHPSVTYMLIALKVHL